MPRLPTMNYLMSHGVEADFSTLLQRFVKTNSVRYEHFAEIWRDMNMSLIFAGRQCDQEVRQFTEECLNIVKAYIQPTSEFQIQVGGLYLMYALYFKQLFTPRVKIRMTLVQWAQLQALMKEVRSQNHSDIEYIYHRLMHDNAFHMTANSTGLSIMDRDNYEDDASRAQRAAHGTLGTEADKVPRSLLTDMAEGDAVDQLSSIHEQYHRIKCALVGPTAKKPSASLDMIDPNVVQHITKKIASFEWWKKYKAGKRGARRRHDSGPTTSESEADSESERSYSPKKSRGVGSIRAEIKARAMGSSAEISRARRHRSVKSLTALEESQESSSTPSRASKANKSYLESSEDDGDDVYGTATTDAGLLNMPLLKHLEEPKGKKKQTRKRKGQAKEPKAKKSRKSKAQDSGDATLNSSVEKGKKRRGRKRKDSLNETGIEVQKVEKGRKRKRQRKIKTEPQDDVDSGAALSTEVKPEELLPISVKKSEDTIDDPAKTTTEEAANTSVQDLNETGLNSGDQADVESEQSQLNISQTSSGLPENKPNVRTKSKRKPRGRGRPPKKKNTA